MVRAHYSAAVSDHPTHPAEPPALRRRFLLVIAAVQGLLALVSVWFWLVLRATWRGWGVSPEYSMGAAALIFGMAPSFVAATLVARRRAGGVARWFYRIAAIWFGFLNYVLLALLVLAALQLGLFVFGVRSFPSYAAAGLLGAAVLTTLIGLVGAFRLRVTRIRVNLANLPPAWSGRTLAVVSDLHLGHVRGVASLRRLIRRLNRLAPDLILIAGDLFDGTAVRARALSEPWRDAQARLGVWAVFGNHDGFTDAAALRAALQNAGVRLLEDATAEVEGLRIAGLSYETGRHPAAMRAVLGPAAVRPTILLAHAPDHPEVAAECGIDLQLSGHTHGGQYFPFTLLVRHIYGPFAHGSYRHGKLQGYTSFGVGTWGPPLRVGTHSELVLVEL